VLVVDPLVDEVRTPPEMRFEMVEMAAFAAVDEIHKSTALAFASATMESKASTRSSDPTDAEEIYDKGLVNESTHTIADSMMSASLIAVP
jgi:hypothetical protein